MPLAKLVFTCAKNNFSAREQVRVAKRFDVSMETPRQLHFLSAPTRERFTAVELPKRYEREHEYPREEEVLKGKLGIVDSGCYLFNWQTEQKTRTSKDCEKNGPYCRHHWGNSRGWSEGRYEQRHESQRAER